jgi:transposase-like protein
MRKRYTNQFTAQVVQELLKEEKTLNQLAAEHGVHPNQLKRWKTIALEGLAQPVQHKTIRRHRPRQSPTSNRSPSCMPRSGG